MKKIPTLFKRYHGGTRPVFDEVAEGCEWVAAGEGGATVKVDGACCRIHDGILWARYERKREGRALGVGVFARSFKPAPAGWEPAEDIPSARTRHWPGWVPVGDGPEHRRHREGATWLQTVAKREEQAPRPESYELVGPKVQGNPYGLAEHRLWTHGNPFLHRDGLRECVSPRLFCGIRDFLAARPQHEGIVWWHPDGRRAKVKRSDFGLPWPTEEAKR